MTHTDGRMVLEAAAGELDELVLEIGNLRDAAAAEEAVLDLILRELTFRRVDDELTVNRLAVGIGHLKRLDAALVRAPARAGITLLEHLVGGDGSLSGHERLSDGTAVEKNNLIRIVSIIVVPVKNGGRLTRSEKHSAHRDCGAKINFARCGDSAVVKLREKHARANTENRLHFVPASERDCVEMILFDVIIDRAGDLCQNLHAVLWNLRAVGVLFKTVDLGLDRRVDLTVLNLVYEFGEVEGFDRDIVLLKSDFIEARRLERRRSRADAADGEALHSADDAADGGEIVEVRLKLLSKRMNDVRRHHGKGNLALGKDIRNGELAAVGVAAMSEVHLADFVGIRLH